MTMHGRARRWLWAALACLACVAALGCGGSNADYRLSKASRGALATGNLRFMLVSDTQYSVPFTDYDVEYQLGQQIVSLPPAVTSTWVSSFYRHAGANFALPYAFEHVVQEEARQGASFGLFGGDLLEFSCRAEADRMFAALLAQNALPFIVTIGNHDSAFHGAYDTDAVARSGQGDWDVYSYGLWGAVCNKLGGRSTKSSFIERLLDYYEHVWELPIHDALGLHEDAAYPRGVHLSGTASKRGWELTLAVKLGAEDAQSHRQSYLYQRWVHRDPSSGKRAVTITVLDTMDYGSRQVLCDAKAKPMQVGLGGAITSGQVEWLEGLAPAKGPHFVLSHYMPFEDVERPKLAGDEKQKEMLSECDTTYGTRCLGARLSAALPSATYIYGHVHQPLEEESLHPRSGKNECTPDKRAAYAKLGDACECIDQDALSLVRLPSLIDNKQYAVFDQGTFEKKNVAAMALASIEPFAKSCNTCQERFAELVEIEENIDCLKKREVNPATACRNLETQIDNREAEATQLCDGLSTSWKATNALEWASYEATCKSWPLTEQWRCILRAKVERVTNGIPEATLRRFGASLLSGVNTTNRGNKKACDAKR